MTLELWSSPFVYKIIILIIYTNIRGYSIIHAIFPAQGGVAYHDKEQVRNSEVGNTQFETDF